MKTVNLPDDIHQGLRILAARRGQTISDLVIEALTPLLSEVEAIPSPQVPSTPKISKKDSETVPLEEEIARQEEDPLGELIEQKKVLRGVRTCKAGHIANENGNCQDKKCPYSVYQVGRKK